MRFQELYEMAFTKKKAEQHISGLEYQFNLHLLKLHAFANFSEGLKAHWRKEISNFLDQISVIRLRPSNKPGPMAFYFKLLYEQPFEGVEVENVTALFRIIARQYRDEGELATTPTTTPEAAAEWLLQYHKQLSVRFSKAEDVSDMVP